MQCLAPWSSAFKEPGKPCPGTIQVRDSRGHNYAWCPLCQRCVSISELMNEIDKLREPVSISLPVSVRQRLTSLGESLEEFHDLPASIPEQLAKALILAGMNELETDKGAEWVESALRSMASEA